MKGCPNVYCFFNIFSFMVLTILVIASAATVPEDDVRCLKGIKDSLRDPKGKLSSWTFSNNSLGFMCNYVGVSCWNDRENRLINLELRKMKLSGSIPDSLMYCGSLQVLDLSANKLSGPIPSEICTWLPYLTKLDLSNNQFTGSIPPNIGKCTYLNEVSLASNKLSGSIPYEFSSLSRLKKFSVANNDLTGRVPSFLDKFGKSSFVGNSGLCGGFSWISLWWFEQEEFSGLSSCRAWGSGYTMVILVG